MGSRLSVRSGEPARRRPTPTTRCAPPRPNPPVGCLGFGPRKFTWAFVCSCFRREVQYFSSRGTVVSWANRPAGILSHPPQPRSPRRAFPRPEPLVVCPGLELDKVPGYALREKGLQRQKGAGPLVSSQEHRALLVPRINRLSTGCQPLVWFPHRGLNGISFVRASGETFRRRVFDALGDTRDACLLGQLLCLCPAQPSPTPLPLRAPRPDPPMVCPGFGPDTLF